MDKTKLTDLMKLCLMAFEQSKTHTGLQTELKKEIHNLEILIAAEEEEKGELYE